MLLLAAVSYLDFITTERMMLDEHNFIGSFGVISVVSAVMILITQYFMLQFNLLNRRIIRCLETIIIPVSE